MEARIAGGRLWGVNKGSVRMTAAIFGLIKWKDGGRAGLGGGLGMRVEVVSSDWRCRAGRHRHPDGIQSPATARGPPRRERCWEGDISRLGPGLPHTESSRR